MLFPTAPLMERTEGGDCYVMPNRWAPTIKGWAIVDGTTGEFVLPNTPGSKVTGMRFNAPNWSQVWSADGAFVRIETTTVIVDQNYPSYAYALVVGSEAYWLVEIHSLYAEFLADEQLRQLYMSPQIVGMIVVEVVGVDEFDPDKTQDLSEFYDPTPTVELKPLRYWWNPLTWFQR